LEIELYELDVTDLIEDTQLNRNEYKDKQLTFSPDITTILGILEALADKNILYLHIEHEISNEIVIEALIELFSKNQTIKDINLTVKYLKDAFKIMKSLSDNYQLGSIYLYSQEEVDDELIKLAEELERKRVILDIYLNTSIEMYKGDRSSLLKFKLPEEDYY
jgi:hypothetical protein